MPTYTINTNPFFLHTEYISTEEEITNNINGYIPLFIDDIPSEVFMIQGFDPDNNLEVYKPGYNYNNFLCLNNDTLLMVCGRSYIIWSDEEDLPYTFTIPDCQTLDAPELPTPPPTETTPTPSPETPSPSPSPGTPTPTP
jgi:hypothetical protein